MSAMRILHSAAFRHHSSLKLRRLRAIRIRRPCQEAIVEFLPVSRCAQGGNQRLDHRDDCVFIDAVVNAIDRMIEAVDDFRQAIRCFPQPPPGENAVVAACSSSPTNSSLMAFSPLVSSGIGNSGPGACSACALQLLPLRPHR